MLLLTNFSSKPVGWASQLAIGKRQLTMRRNSAQQNKLRSVVVTVNHMEMALQLPLCKSYLGKVLKDVALSCSANHVSPSASSFLESSASL